MHNFFLFVFLQYEILLLLFFRVTQRNRMSNDQIQAFISYMEEHTLFARGQIPKLGAQGHIKFKEMWMKLTTQLNMIGPCIKTEKDWQEVICLLLIVFICLFIIYYLCKAYLYPF